MTLRVLGGAFDAVAKEMADVLFRMSYSTIIRESEDLGAGVFDAQGRELCERDSTPMHIGSLPWYIRGFLRAAATGEIEDGDVIIHNHPYLGASHTPDVMIAVPIFCDGELLGFAGVRRTCSTSAARSRALTPTRSTSRPRGRSTRRCAGTARGVLNDELGRMIFENVRTGR